MVCSFADRERRPLNNFGDLQIFEWFVGMKDETDVIAGAPAVALLDFPEEALRAFLEHGWVLVVRAVLADMAQEISWR